MSDTTNTSPESMQSSPSVTVVIKACDMCRKKKIKCEPTGQTCVQCIRYKTLCHFTPISTKRAARKPAGHKRVEELEKRLKSMEESLKRATAKLQQPPSTGQSEQSLVRREVPMQVLSEEVVGWGSPSFIGHLVENDPMDLVVNTPWDTPLPQDLDTTYSYGALISTRSGPASVPMWNDRPVTDMFARKIFKPLPPKEEMLELISISLQGFNEAFPLFEEAFFIDKLNDPETSIQDPAFWAALNVILAMANRFRIAISTADELDESETWKYFQNALSVVNQIMLLPPSLLSIKALLGMAILIQGTPNPAPYAFLNNAAMKMAQQLNLHRVVRNQIPALSATQVEERKRIFWIAYSMDKDISLRTGQPPVQDDDDMDVQLPEYCTHKANSANLFFRLRIKLALIQGKIYKKLLSVRASKQSVAERVSAVRSLEASLQTWKTSVPPEYQQEYTMLPHWDLKKMTPVIHSLILRLTYFHALNAVHRFSTPVNDWQNLMELPVHRNPTIVHEPPAPITCIEEARKALKLLLVTPQGDFACIWVVLHIFVSATTTLLTYILSNPLHPLAQSDLQLIEPLLSLLGLLSMQGKNIEVEGMYESSRTMWERARRTVWEARGSGLPADPGPMNLTPVPMLSQGKVVEDKESLEDFIKRIENIAGGSETNAFEYEFEFMA
ncbi:hypothetical protein VTL71DRAFT_116 [Oculimacula yallundae]|uniref:Zn(2)-C6 fungal-type domain-containing protein n=1 Tax=Oculimacula yallundae TaxID=86028 RepID=A0ABR4CZ63_9HELO